jgi:hypothetical protein
LWGLGFSVVWVVLVNGPDLERLISDSDVVTIVLVPIGLVVVLCALSAGGTAGIAMTSVYNLVTSRAWRWRIAPSVAFVLCPVVAPNFDLDATQGSDLLSVFGRAVPFRVVPGLIAAFSARVSVRTDEACGS